MLHDSKYKVQFSTCLSDTNNLLFILQRMEKYYDRREIRKWPPSFYFFDQKLKKGQRFFLEWLPGN